MQIFQEYLNGVGNLVQRGGKAEVNIAFKVPRALNISVYFYFLCHLESF
jgi:hypothetical protein